MKENQKKPKNNNIKKPKIKIKGLDIDRAEYEEIILSNSNAPDRSFYR